MDTWDASRLLESLGVVFNTNPQEADATAQILAEAGIVSARVEIGWGSLDYDDDSRLLPQQQENVRQVLGALRRHGIRPLILLNSHSGLPAPAKSWEVELVKPAIQGDKVIYLSESSEIEPHYTGLRGVAHYMYPVITAIDPQTGRATLSAPLPASLPEGKIGIGKLKYRPFSGTHTIDGMANPAAQETLDGWMTYVRTVTTFVKEILGTTGSQDAGFDVEVWNELSFGSHFLYSNEYYDPPIEYGQKLSYRHGDREETGPQVILPMTAAYVKDPVNELPGVKVINGFANQRPWDHGASLWPGQTGFSRHYYTGWDPVASMITPENQSLKRDTLLNRWGEPDVSGFIPAHVSAFPERWYYAYQTEYVVRDLQPFPGPWKEHHRYSHPGDNVPPEVWMTESNLYRGAFAKELANQSGVELTNVRLSRVMHYMGTKSTLRNYIFQSHKGIKLIHLYAAKSKDTEYALLPESFYEELKRSDYRLTPDVRREAGPQIQAIRNVVDLMKEGETIDQPRFLGVESIQSDDDVLVFEGNGTEALPDRYRLEDLAVLPFQLRDNAFAVAYYIVTRDITHSWHPEQGLLDPARYDMQEVDYEITLSNVAGLGVSLTVYDPITDEQWQPRLIEATKTTLTVRLPVTDTPRFLMIQEEGPQPLIVTPVLAARDSGATFSFTATVAGEALLQWGAYPLRSAADPANRYEFIVQAGEQVMVDLPDLVSGDGIKLMYTSEQGIETSYPYWDYDVRGVFRGRDNDS
ncbi:hypothetical protein [Paenibacillus sp. 1P07SE]|uniref:hypothetical protein n=1 Tax=Paenibacillus sp. 1P07SE TaxID=3132209 RepID=UPI0039A4B21B